MISKDNWRKYIDRLAAIDKRAADQMQEWIDIHGLADTDALIEYAYGLISKYGEASATLSCDMYDYMADLMDADVPEAIPAETATINEVARGVTWGKYHSPSQIPSVVSRQVRQTGADTMIQNAKRDNAEWAWVPQGDTCAFCITLASRGWQEASKTVLRGNHAAEHIHQNCDCTFAIAFKEKDKRQYDYIYDPDKYLDMYNEAGGDLNAMRRKIYDANIDEINAQRRDAYQAKQLFVSSDSGGNNEPLRITQIRASYITERVNDGTYSLKLSYQNYNKHVEGHRDYERYKDSRVKNEKTPPSILTISYEETQEIIEKQSGRGIIPSLTVEEKKNARTANE